MNLNMPKNIAELIRMNIAQRKKEKEKETLNQLCPKRLCLMLVVETLRTDSSDGKKCAVQQQGVANIF